MRPDVVSRRVPRPFAFTTQMPPRQLRALPLAKAIRPLGTRPAPARSPRPHRTGERPRPRPRRARRLRSCESGARSWRGGRSGRSARGSRPRARPVVHTAPIRDRGRCDRTLVVDGLVVDRTRRVRSDAVSSSVYSVRLLAPSDAQNARSPASTIAPGLPRRARSDAGSPSACRTEVLHGEDVAMDFLGQAIQAR